MVELLFFHFLLGRYATASARSDGLLLLCGGRDASSVVSYPSAQKFSFSYSVDLVHHAIF